MAKRFTDTDKYKKPFIRGLQGAYKLFWDYLYHSCDHAGIWIVDFEIAQIYLGQDMQVNKEDALKYFNEGEQRIIEIENNKWFIPSFIDFQYGILNIENRAHKSVIQILNKYNLINDKGLLRGLQAYKDKDKDKDKDKRKVFIKPTPEEIQAYLNEMKCTYFTGKYFFDKNEAIGWLVGKNKTPMKDWKATVRTWISNGNDKQNKETPVKKPSDNYKNVPII